MAAADERQGEVALSLPQFVCDRLASLAGSDESLEQAVISLVREADRRRRLSSSFGNEPRTGAAPSAVGPEVHGGPEGVYQRDGSTGRWRSVSRSAPVCRKETVQQPPPVSEEIPADLAAARETIKKAKAETAKLWEAASSLLPGTAEPSAEALRAGWEQSHALAQADLEKKMQAKAWEMIRGSADMKTFTLITRRATGCEGERALSVGAARNIFEAPPPVDHRSSMTRHRSRPHSGKAAAPRSAQASEDVSSKVRQESPSARFRSFLRQGIKGGA